MYLLSFGILSTEGEGSELDSLPSVSMNMFVLSVPAFDQGASFMELGILNFRVTTQF